MTTTPTPQSVPPSVSRADLALEWLAAERTAAEINEGGDGPLWGQQTPEQRIARMGERRRARDAAILNAREARSASAAGVAVPAIGIWLSMDDAPKDHPLFVRGWNWGRASGDRHYNIAVWDIDHSEWRRQDDPDHALAYLTDWLAAAPTPPPPSPSDDLRAENERWSPASQVRRHERGGWTPGPWSVPDKGYGWDHFAAIISRTGLVATCHLAALSRDYSQSTADARLIASAPEIYEALVDLEAYLRNTPHHNAPEAAAARKALAKTGDVE